MDSILNWLKEFNNSYSNAVIALMASVGTIIAFFFKKIFDESKRKDDTDPHKRGDAYFDVKPIFWTIGKKYKILAVHKFEIDNQDISGYKHLGQNSRPDQWKQLIIIKSQFKVRHEIVPLNENDILTVIISRNGKERWRTINFNK